VRQTVDDGDRLAAAAFLLHPQLRDDALRNRRGRRGLTALAVALRPAAAWTDAADARGIHEPAAIGHDGQCSAATLVGASPVHSHRSAPIGSIRVARRAGTYEAAT